MPVPGPPGDRDTLIISSWGAQHLARPQVSVPFFRCAMPGFRCPAEQMSCDPCSGVLRLSPNFQKIKGGTCGPPLPQAVQEGGGSATSQNPAHTSALPCLRSESGWLDTGPRDGPSALASGCGDMCFPGKLPPYPSQQSVGEATDMAWGTEDQGESRTEKGGDRSIAACRGPCGQAEGAQGVRAAGRGGASWSRVLEQTGGSLWGRLSSRPICRWHRRRRGEARGPVPRCAGPMGPHTLSACAWCRLGSETRQLRGSLSWRPIRGPYFPARRPYESLGPG